MRAAMSAGPNTPFVGRLMPMARQAGSSFALRPRRAAFGQSALIIAVTALVAGIIALPLLHGLAVPLLTASEMRPELLRSSPIAPALLQPQENGWDHRHAMTSGGIATTALMFEPNI